MLNFLNVKNCNVNHIYPIYKLLSIIFPRSYHGIVEEPITPSNL